MSEPLSERMWDLSLRVDRIVHLPTCGGENMGDDMFDFLTDDAEELVAKACGLDVEKMHACIEEYGDKMSDQREAFGALLAHADPQGWIVQVAQPVYTSHGEGKGASFSWGYCNLRRFAGATYDDALDAALEWAEQEIAGAMGG